MLPLQGITVLDFSQFLAGPLCALRLADLGARVIKVERPDGGDLCRQLYISNLRLDDDSTLFHSINRNKESFSANLKDPADLARVKRLVAQADVVIQNFRPGVMKRLGLDYNGVRAINTRAVYGSISGYGDDGPWKDKPGQDLLAQALSGVLWLSGDAGGNDDAAEDRGPPVPMGLAVADMFAGHFLVQGILACLVRRGITGEGGLVETSLLESLLDFQFEVLTTHLNDGRKAPHRAAQGNGHAYLGAPYGVYRTADGWLVIAMNPLDKMGSLLDLPQLVGVDRADTFARRDAIKRVIARRIAQRTTREWLDVLEPADVWCAEVLNWERLLAHEGFSSLQMVQKVIRSSGSTFDALRCPVRVDGSRLYATKGSPSIGEHNQSIAEEFGL
ncbi:MAG TPA: CaiB/BaiF CoA-transferase family protein [Tepidisphaeraceae bacterium]|jgi:crotonobetainyl-CoA:carnitine CoA-transferase CaiB-like acyl-CoA transferase